MIENKLSAWALGWSLVFLLLTACTRGDQQQYRAVSKTDNNGFSYTVVTNDLSETRIYKLKNGLTVYLNPNRSSTYINATVIVNAGTSFDPENNSGLAHYLEHCLFEGTSKIGALDWSREKPLLAEIAVLYERHKNAHSTKLKKRLLSTIDSLNYEASKFSINGELSDIKKTIGVNYASARTDFDKTRYFSQFPKTSLEHFLIVESERFREFVPRNFQNTLEEVYEEFNKESDDLWEVKFNAILQESFKMHPYRITPIGLSEHLKNPSVEATQAFFDKYYVPNNMALVLTGDFDFDQTIKLVNKTFGDLSRKDLSLPSLPREEPLKETRKAEVLTQDEPSVYLAFRLDNKRSINQSIYLSIVDRLLENGYAGLFDKNLIGQQKVAKAQSDIEKMRDYSLHLIDGYPKPDQKLEEVEQLILKEIDRLKQGDFEEELLTAVKNELSITFSNDLNNKWLGAGPITDAFVNGISWNQQLALVDKISRVTKSEIARFTSEFYDNHVVVYKRKGERSPQPKVEKPKLTIPYDNSGYRSDFAKKISNIPMAKLDPQFIDFAESIKKHELIKGIEIAHVSNDGGSTFELDFVFDYPNDQSFNSEMTLSLFEKIGTRQLSAEEFRKQFYILGLKTDFYSSNGKIILHLEGLEKSLLQGVELLLQLLEDPFLDPEVLQKEIEIKIQERDDFRTNYEGLMLAAREFALFGEGSKYKNEPSKDQLASTSVSQVRGFIKNLKSTSQEMHYFGDRIEELKDFLSKYYTPNVSYSGNTTSQIKARIPSSGKVYFIDSKMAQAHLFVYSRGDKYNQVAAPYFNMLNFYISNVFWDEIGNKRSLAYRGYAYHSEANSTSEFGEFIMYTGTQVDKYQEALDVMVEFIKNLPKNESKYELIHSDLLKRFEAERITGPSIYWNYHNLSRLGINFDLREFKYNEIQSIKLDDIAKFHDAFFKRNNYDLVVIGDSSKIDLSVLAKYGKLHVLKPDDIM